MLYYCDYCSFCCRKRLLLIKHQFQAHHFEDNFNYKCEISSRGYVFARNASYASFLTHCNRKHDKWREALNTIDSEEDTQGPGRGEEVAQDGESDQGTGEPVSLARGLAVVDQRLDKPMGTSHVDNVDQLSYKDLEQSKADIEQAVTQFLLIFKEKYKLTQAAINFAVKSVTDIVKLTSENIEQHVLAQLVKIDPCNDYLSRPFPFTDHFMNLRTEYQQNKYYRDNLGLIVG